MGGVDLLGGDRAALAVGQVEAVAGVGRRGSCPSPCWRRCEWWSTRIGRSRCRTRSTCFAPSRLRRRSRSVPMKAELTLLVISGSSPCGPKPGRNALPGVPGRQGRARLDRIMADMDDRASAALAIRRSGRAHWRPSRCSSGAARRERRSPAAGRSAGARCGRGRGPWPQLSEAPARRLTKRLAGVISAA